MNSRFALALALLAAVGFLHCAATADSYRIDPSCISAGGGAASNASYAVTGTVGQPAVGLATNTSFIHWIGFWSGEVPVPMVVPSIGAAKLLGNGTFVCVPGRIATTTVGDFSGCFYVEELNRTMGLRIAGPPEAVAGLDRGRVVNVIGTMGTAPNGERQMTGPIAIVVSSATPLTPFAMTNRSLGGSTLGTLPLGQQGVTGARGLNNVGLLVKTCGRVTAAGTGYVEIDDGSGPVRIDSSTLSSPPGIDDYVIVVGISSLYKSGSDYLRYLLPRGDTDLWAW